MLDNMTSLRQQKIFFQIIGQNKIKYFLHIVSIFGKERCSLPNVVQTPVEKYIPSSQQRNRYHQTSREIDSIIFCMFWNMIYSVSSQLTFLPSLMEKHRIAFEAVIKYLIQIFILYIFEISKNENDFMLCIQYLFNRLSIQIQIPKCNTILFLFFFKE